MTQYCIRLAKLRDIVPSAQPHVDSADVAHFEHVANLELSFGEIFDAYLVLAYNLAVIFTTPHEFSDGCGRGAMRVMADVLALMAARPANDQTDLGKKVIASEMAAELAAGSDQYQNLPWLLAASVRADCQNLFPGWSREATDALLERMRQAHQAN